MKRNISICKIFIKHLSKRKKEHLFKSVQNKYQGKITTDFKAVCNTKYKLSSYIDYLCIQHNNIEENLQLFALFI